MSTSLVVKVTCGADDPERANQGVTVAATALAAGVAVSLWLTGEGVWLAVEGRGFQLEHGAATDDLIGTVLAGGTVTVCTQCAARRGLTEDDVRAGVRIAGAATFVDEAISDGAKALVY